MTREQAINYLISSGFTHEQVGEVVRALTYEPTTKNDLGVDCISRADAIRVASGYCHPSNVAKELAKLPSVTLQPRWIPVSERLPEEDGEYLATIYDMDENHEYMDIAELEDGKWCYKPYILVKAWMPLPQAHREVEE